MSVSDSTPTLDRRVPSVAVEIRPYTAADAAAVSAILNESIAERDSLMILEPFSVEEIRRQHEALGPHEAVLLMEVRREVVGWGIVKRYSEREGYRHTGETSVYLRRSHTDQGLGSRLQQALLDRSRELGYHHLVARIFADNARSIGMHRKFGYEIVGVQREVGLVDGAWRDVAIMQYVLKEQKSGA